jgi:hypothetical protein
MRARGFWLAATAAVVLGGIVDAQRRIVCIDQRKDAMGMPIEDGFLSNHEGYERARAGDNDVIVRGGTLTDCLAMVQNGDTLVIVTHGVSINGMNGAGFEWCGQVYRGFGNGPMQMPVPPGFGNHMNVTVQFCSCWSDNDPDGPTGQDTSLTDKIEQALGGTGNGNNADGYTGEATIGPRICYDYPDGVDTPAEEMAYDKLIDDCIDADTSWVDKPPVNRSNPPPPMNQQSCLQQILNDCDDFDAETPAPTITLKYNRAPTDTADGGRLAGSQGRGLGGAFSCGLTDYGLDGNSHGVPVPAMALGALLTLAAGLGLALLRRS